MAVATLAMAATSGIQALLYLSSFGVGGRTDGFFVAFALYTSFGVFSQSIRVTSAPLLVGARRGSPPASSRSAWRDRGPGGARDDPARRSARRPARPGPQRRGPQASPVEALPILGVAMVLQLWAAGGATVLAVRDRFDRIAVAYIPAPRRARRLRRRLRPGRRALARLVDAGDGGRHLRDHAARSPRRPRGRRPGARCAARSAASRAAVGLILGSTHLPRLQRLYVITLAFAGRYEPGDATVLSYAYLFASYLVAGTGFALGMSRIADMRRGALVDWREVIADTVPPGFRYSMLIGAPGAGRLIAGGAPLVGEVLPASFDPTSVDQLQVFAALLAPGWWRRCWSTCCCRRVRAGPLALRQLDGAGRLIAHIA